MEWGKKKCPVFIRKTGHSFSDVDGTRTRNLRIDSAVGRFHTRKRGLFIAMRNFDSRKAAVRTFGLSFNYHITRVAEWISDLVF